MPTSSLNGILKLCCLAADVWPVHLVPALQQRLPARLPDPSAVLPACLQLRASSCCPTC